jgi:putative ABC transport system ATP-binding protein
VWVGGTKVTGLKDRGLTELRRDKVGFVFQQFNLLPTLTAEENIVLPLQLAGRRVDQAWFDAVVERVGLADRTKHRPSELSGGQQQRVAVARALVAEPTVLFADEPTGNLDSKSSHEVLELLRDAAASFGQTTVMVTHDNDAAAAADRLIHLEDGVVVSDEVTR